MIPVTIDSDEKKAWVVGKVPIHVFAALEGLPGRKRYVNGTPFFEPSRSNLEYINNRLENVTWRGPARRLLDQYLAMRAQEQEARDNRALEFTEFKDDEFPFKTKPYDHQHKCFGLARAALRSSVPSYGLFMEQGCVDSDTEYLTPSGWKKISNYSGGKVGQWSPEAGLEFVEPLAYVSKPCPEMYHFHSKYGADQMLSPDHRMLLIEGRRPVRKTPNDGWCEYIRELPDGTWLIETTPRKLVNRYAGCLRTKNFIPSTFHFAGEEYPLTDAELRLQVAFHADGSFGVASMDRSPSGKRMGCFRLKKEHKKERLRLLFSECEISYTEKERPDGFSVFGGFRPPVNSKHFVDEFWWGLSAKQRLLVAEEAELWDGSAARGEFYSSREDDLSYIQFCRVSTGHRARSLRDLRSREGGLVKRTSERLHLPMPTIVPSTDGRMYCFQVPSSYLVFRRNGCVFVSGNTGKTKVILDLTADLFVNGGSKGKIDTLVVVAPNGVHAQWINEQVDLHLPECVPWRGAYTVASPSPEERRMMAEALAFKDGVRVIAVHVDSLSQKKGQEFLRELLSSSRAFLVVDESSRIKDMSSKRTKFIVEVAKLAPYRLIATGTPVSQGAEDLYSQFYFLDRNILGYDSFYSFRNHFCRMGGYQAKKIVGYQNEEELKRKIDSYTFRVLKDDCLDLPRKNFIRREVLFTPEQRKVYDQMRKDFFLDLEEGVLTARMALTRIIRLQQIVSGFISRSAKKDELGRIVEPALFQELPNGRAAAAVEIIREAQGKVIVWVKFEGDHKLLTRALDDAGIGWVDYVGPTPQKDRAANIERFRTDPTCKVFISSPKSGGTGLNLTVASEVIWYSRDFSLENELQANDRCHRIGQDKVVNYHYLVTPRTVDDRIDKLLRGKLSVAESLIDLRNLVE